MKKVYVFISVFIVCVLLVIYVLVLKSEPFSDISPITVDGEYIIQPAGMVVYRLSWMQMSTVPKYFRFCRKPSMLPVQSSGPLELL